MREGGELRLESTGGDTDTLEISKRLDGCWVADGLRENHASHLAAQLQDNLSAKGVLGIEANQGGLLAKLTLRMSLPALWNIMRTSSPAMSPGFEA
jgi:hypothetical protein